MIEAVLLLLLGAGMFFLTMDNMRQVYGNIGEAAERWFSTFKDAPRQIGVERKERDRVWEHIRLLLNITLGLGSDKSVKAFGVISAVPAALAIVLLSGKIPVKLVLLVASVGLLIPYALLQIKLERLRNSASQEGEILLTELLENYKINFSNMQQAIEVTALTIEEAPVCKRILSNLSKGINLAGAAADMSRLVKEFRLSLNTSWGNILSGNIYFALTSGVDVTEAMNDLTVAISNARKIKEHGKRENNEANIIMKYMIPAVYLLTVFGGVKYFGLSFSQFIKYQFRTEAGLTWFIISLTIYVTGLLIKSFLSKNRLDF